MCDLQWVTDSFAYEQSENEVRANTQYTITLRECIYRLYLYAFISSCDNNLYFVILLLHNVRRGQTNCLYYS